MEPNSRRVSLMDSMRCMLLLCVLSPFVAFSQSSAPGAVAGHVYCADTHTPCRFATVNIQAAPRPRDGTPTSSNTQPRAYFALTNINGAFEIDGVEPGEYYILAREPGYLSDYDLARNNAQQQITAASPAMKQYLSRITVTAGQTTAADVNLRRGASLEGTVRYDDGGLAIGLPVKLYRKSDNGQWKIYKNGARAGTLAVLDFDARTDDRGRFYEPGLPAGSYIVEVTLPNVSMLPMTISGQQSLNVTSTQSDALAVFSGNKFRLKDASPIELDDGEARQDLDIEIPTMGLHTIRGVAADENGVGVPQGTARLLDPDDKTVLRETQIGQEGVFVFRFVAPGQYLLQVTPQARGSGQRAGSQLRQQTIPLQVVGDMTNLSVTLANAGH